MQSRTLTILTLVAALLDLPCAMAQAPQDPARASYLIEQARLAIGGAALEKVTSLSAVGTFQRTAGEHQMSGETSIELQLPDKFLRTEMMSPFGDATVTRQEGVNGNELLRHSASSGGGMIVMREPEGPAAEAAMLRSMRAEMARLMIVWLLAPPPDASFEFSYAGEAEAADGRADVLDIRGNEGFAARLFLDQRTHLPLMLSYRGNPPRMVISANRAGGPHSPDRIREGQEIARARVPADAEIQLFLEDYKRAEGLLLPHRMSRSIDGEPNEELTITKFVANPPFKPEMFLKK